MGFGQEVDLGRCRLKIDYSSVFTSIVYMLLHVMFPINLISGNLGDVLSLNSNR